MPTVQQELPSQATHAQVTFRVEHEPLKAMAEYAVILGLVVVLVMMALMVLGPTPSAITYGGPNHV